MILRAHTPALENNIQQAISLLEINHPENSLKGKKNTETSKSNIINISERDLLSKSVLMGPADT